MNVAMENSSTNREHQKQIDVTLKTVAPADVLYGYTLRGNYLNKSFKHAL
jgi:hypothetical protein